MGTVNSSASEIFVDREIYPLPGGTNYYQPIDGINVTPSKRREYYTKEEIDKIIADAIGGGGAGGEGIKSMTCTFEDLPELSKDTFGTIINVTDAFTTDSRFVDGAGKKYPSNTNVMVTYDINSSSYKFDVMMGEIKGATNDDIQDIIDDLYKD